jgi:hypothetical protein
LAAYSFILTLILFLILFASVDNCSPERQAERPLCLPIATVSATASAHFCIPSTLSAVESVLVAQQKIKQPRLSSKAAPVSSPMKACTRAARCGSLSSGAGRPGACHTGTGARPSTDSLVHHFATNNPSPYDPLRDSLFTYSPVSFPSSYLFFPYCVPK